MKNNANKWKKKPHNKTRNTHTHTQEKHQQQIGVLAKLVPHLPSSQFISSWELKYLFILLEFPFSRVEHWTIWWCSPHFTLWINSLFYLSSRCGYVFFSFLHFGKIEKNERFSIELYSGSFVCQKMFSCLHNSYVFKEIYNFRFKFGFGFWDTFFIISSVKHFGWNLFYR